MPVSMLCLVSMSYCMCRSERRWGGCVQFNRKYNKYVCSLWSCLTSPPYSKIPLLPWQTIYNVIGQSNVMYTQSTSVESENVHRHYNSSGHRGAYVPNLVKPLNSSSDLHMTWLPDPISGNTLDTLNSRPETGCLQLAETTSLSGKDLL